MAATQRSGQIGKLSAYTRKEFRRVRRKLDRLAGNLDKATPEAIRVIAEDIMLDVKSSRPGKGVPKDEGTLQSSGRVTQSGKVAELSFGGASAPYALIQHENEQYAHTLGEARYLIRGVERWSPGGASAQRARAELQREIDKLAAKGKRGGGRPRDARGRFIKVV